MVFGEIVFVTTLDDDISRLNGYSGFLILLVYQTNGDCSFYVLFLGMVAGAGMEPNILDMFHYI